MAFDSEFRLTQSRMGLANRIKMQVEWMMMMDRGAIVTYKEFNRKLDGLCGIVEGTVTDQPEFVWVRWIGETSKKKENVSDLEVV